MPRKQLIFPAKDQSNDNNSGGRSERIFSSSTSGLIHVVARIKKIEVEKIKKLNSI